VSLTRRDGEPPAARAVRRGERLTRHWDKWGDMKTRRGLTRRAVLGRAVGGALAGAGALASGAMLSGCAWLGPDPEPPHPLLGLHSETRALLARYQAALPAYPDLAERLTPLRDNRPAHLKDSPG
jgi:Tryptophan 2,3-dioxygenase (vermilion)